MKITRKIMGVGLILVLLSSMLVMAVPVSAGTLSWTVSTDIPDATDKVVQNGTNLTDMAVSADGQTIYVPSGTFSLGANDTNSTAVFSTAQKVSGTNSALLTHTADAAGSTYVEFVPNTGTTLSEFDLQATEWSFNHFTSVGADNHAQLELVFTDPLSAAHVDVTVMALQNYTGTAAWVKTTLATTTTNVIYYGNERDGSAQDYTTTGMTVGGIIDQIYSDFDPATDAEVAAFVLTKVRLELWEASARSVYIDDVTIDGVLYDVEPGDLYKSTDGGDSFSTVTLPTTLSQVKLVAVPADNDDIVVIAGDANNLEAHISVNGGSTWSSLGTIKDVAGTAAAAIYDIAMSPLSGSSRYIAAAGTEAANQPAIYYFEFGATVGSWKDACDDFTTPFVPAITTTATTYDGTVDSFRSVAFSPSFPSDQVMVAVSEQVGILGGTDEGAVRFHIASFNQQKWDAGVFTSYPVLLEGVTNAFLRVNAADIALDPEYLGGDDTTRIAFVGLSVTTTTEAGGVYRLKDTTLEPDQENIGINSVAWDGVNMVAGAYADNNVYRCADALASSPTYSTSRSYKEIGVDDALANDQVIVAWGDSSTLLGVKQGKSSAFSRSIDNGKVWNDIALIDTTLSVMEDVWVSPDGSVTYLLTQDTDDTVTMLWRKASAWQRIFCVSDVAGHIVRAAASDADVVYIADDGNSSTTMYYSTDGGTDKWTVRASRYDIADLAVQDADVAYVANYDNDEVSKTTNGGFTWGADVDSLSAGGVCSTLTLIADDELLLGTSTGYVSYSSDGNSSWTKISDVLAVAGAAQVTASGLATGDYIFAATNGVTTKVERWQIGQSSTDWKDLAAPVVAGDMCYGLLLNEGALYAMSANASASSLLRTLDTTTTTPASSKWVTVTSTADFDTAPSALRLSTGSTTLWAIDTAAAGLWSFIDTLATGLDIELLSPVAGYQNPVNPVSGNSQDISFKWTKPESSTASVAYEVRIKAADGATTLATGVRAATDSAAPNLLMGPNQGTSSAQTIQFAPGSTYYWQVRATTPVDSPWSALRSFTIETLQAAVPEVLAPANGGTTTKAMPSFSWSPVSGATKYQFKLADNVGLTTPKVDITLTSTGYAMTEALTVGNTYYWAVRSLEPVQGTWSAIANFTVMAAATATQPAVIITQVPAPQITITQPAAAPATTITIPAAPAAPAPITPAFIWAIIIIGAILVIAVIVLIVRTRRTV